MTRTAALALAAVRVALVLAGCGGKAGPATHAETAARPPLHDGKGAITGIVIDDRYRPVPDALVLLTPVGLTATSDAEGQFAFGDLDPGSYFALVQSADHEAAPKNIDVGTGRYTEVELEARRTFSGLSDLITTQYSIFIPCAASAVVVTAIMDCMVDESGDSYRVGFTADYTKAGKNATYLVVEFLASQSDGYYVPLSGCGKYYDGGTFVGRYNRYLLQRGNATPDHPKSDGYDAWRNDCKTVSSVVFYVGSAQDTFRRYAGTEWGAGARLAVKATFLNSLFVGPPVQDITSYAPMRPPDQ
ncbi:MAG: carboxypeptidase-like regulatory domain-containing protein [bacterium]